MTYGLISEKKCPVIRKKLERLGMRRETVIKNLHAAGFYFNSCTSAEGCIMQQFLVKKCGLPPRGLVYGVLNQVKPKNFTAIEDTVRENDRRCP